MLCENIKAIRKSKGLSQEELAIKLNVVRQTISKWEQGLSVPDADMLISLSEAFETPVSTLLGEPVTAAKADDLKAVSEKLEIKFAAGTGEGAAAKNSSLPAYWIVYGHRNYFRSFHLLRESLSGVELSRSGNRRCWSRFSRI